MHAFAWFVFALIYAVVAWLVAQHAARGLAAGDGYDLVSRGMLLFLLLVGYGSMGRAIRREHAPLAAMGLGRRPGWGGEFALGLSLGWAGIVACTLCIATLGSLAVRVNTAPHQLLLFLVDLLVLAIASLVEEIVFRGYPFQRLIEAIGPTAATLLASLIFAVLHLQNPDATAASTLSTFFAGWLFSVAYLRTRALWVGWGIHLGWNASTCLLFGLPVSGLTLYSPVISTYTRGPIWLTGGGYGPEGSAISIVVLIALLFVLTQTTRDLKHLYAAPVIVPGGIPVDIDALSRSQHEQGMGPGAALAPAGQQLVQILAPAPAPPLPASREEAEPPV